MIRYRPSETYKGWTIVGPNVHLVTGRWRAVQYGVWMGTTTKEGLFRMIDQKIEDEIERRRNHS